MPATHRSAVPTTAASHATASASSSIAPHATWSATVPAVRRALVFVLLTACVPQEPARAPEVVLPLAAANAVAIAPSSSAVRSPFAGPYQGSLGFIVLEQSDGALVSVGSRTTLRCVGLSDLECTWKADGEHGWAKLRLDDAANLRGEWGKDGTAVAAGTWVLLRVDPQADDGVRRARTAPRVHLGRGRRNRRASDPHAATARQHRGDVGLRLERHRRRPVDVGAEMSARQDADVLSPARRSTGHPTCRPSNRSAAGRSRSTSPASMRTTRTP